MPVLAQQHEVSGVGHQHQPVAFPIAADLVAFGGEPSVVVGQFHLHHTALRRLSLFGMSLLHLLGGIQADVGVPRALLRHLAHAEHLGPECTADRVQQVVQGRIIGQLTGPATRRPDAA